MSPSLAREVLAVHAPVNNHDMVGYFMRNVWDDKGAIAAMDQNVLWGRIHRAVYQLNREPFLSQAGHVVTTNIEKETLRLVSSKVPVSTLKRQQRAAVVVHSPTEYEASFFPLIRHFVADMVLPALYGAGFMEKYPDIAADLFQFDSNFDLFLMGLPPWMPLPGLRESAAARDRVKKAMEDLHDAIKNIEAAGHRNDVDVSSVMKERVRLWEEAVGGSSCSKEAYIASHAFLLWVTLINANVIVFWLLFHIYQDPSLLAAIRGEVSPFVQVQDGHTVKLDPPAIRTQTPLLQSAFLETMRLYTQSNSFKNVQADFTVSESESDQYIRESSLDGSKDRQGYPASHSQRVYQLQKGDMICVPFGVHQSDPRYWDHPEKFDGRRFLTQGGIAGKTGARPLVDYTRISPWGSGASLCKGQKLSSREVLEIAAAILVCWDMEPAGTTEWVHPGLARAGGTAVPKADFRGRLRRRVP
ncbi:cytochrome P450 [Aspergillus puulaauensis]|uniref:Cytochrome P450 n=1 Tax=Aspergillus puulaauensis TaxID=1220207 RepID=A0A7R7XJG1_9EURO|nr:uncharacterized protein APUU_30852A [Aspergillus puulaauensis]BCS22627.1 hypothetical protein APUU_30852A [Aspergillus puulaauensis]